VIRAIPWTTATETHPMEANSCSRASTAWRNSVIGSSFSIPRDSPTNDFPACHRGRLSPERNVRGRFPGARSALPTRDCKRRNPADRRPERFPSGNSRNSRSSPAACAEGRRFSGPSVPAREAPGFRSNSLAPARQSPKSVRCPHCRSRFPEMQNARLLRLRTGQSMRAPVPQISSDPPRAARRSR
jgi:hypothetical protein